MGPTGSADPRVPPRARLLARLALAAALVAVAVLLGVTGLGGVVILVVGLAGLALAGAGAWWALAHRGPLRLVGALVAVGGPVTVLVVYTRSGLWSAALAALALWGVALACARSALRTLRSPHGMHAVTGPRPVRPVLIMNPRSGGGKVGRFALVERAERLGARVVLLDPSSHQDVTALARRAVAEGADLLGVAGGDGTQALVAAVAAEHGLPFLVISAGTRNHLDAEVDGTRLDAQQALLVSNNPYSVADPLTVGRRPRLDLGSLGVVGIRVDGPAQAAELALLGPRATGLSVRTGHRVVVHAEAPTIPVAVDGEALNLPTPVVCTLRPKALRVLVPRSRPGSPVTTPPLDWRRITALALGRPWPEERAG